MESRHEVPSVIAKLMGLDKGHPQHPVRERHRVLSDKYLQRVASIGVRKKQLSDDRSFGMSSEEKEESEDWSMDNGIENSASSEERITGVGRQLLDAEYFSGTKKPGILIKSINSFNIETSIKSDMVSGGGNLQLHQKTNKRLQKDVRGEHGLYEMFRFSKPELGFKAKTFPSRIVVLKPNPGKGNCYEAKSCVNFHFSNALCEEFSHPARARAYPKVQVRKKLDYHMDSPKQQPSAFNKTSEEVSGHTGNVTNMVSSSFFRWSEYTKGSDALKPASNASGNENECYSSFCSCGSYAACEAKNIITEKSQVEMDHTLSSQLHHGSGNRNLFYKPDKNGYQSDSNDAQVNLSITSKIDMKNSYTRKVALPEPLFETSVSVRNPKTRSKDYILHNYRFLRHDASLNWVLQKSKKKVFHVKDCSEHTNLRSRCKKSQCFLSSFYSNYKEENCVDLNKLRKYYWNDSSDQKLMLPQSSRLGNPSGLKENQIVQETCIIKEVRKNMLANSNMSKENAVSPNSSTESGAGDARTEFVGQPFGNPKEHRFGATVGILLQRDCDSSSPTSCSSVQKEASYFREEDSEYSLCSGTDPDSLVTLEEAYETSPVSVLEPSFREDISSISKRLEVVGSDISDSSDMDNEETELNVSSDEDSREGSVGDLGEKEDLARFFRAEESRDFSYVVEVLTEARFSNKSLLTDFLKWHSSECPISPSVFEILEKKFGEQPYWKRSDRRVLFDRINLGLSEILQPCMCIPAWEKPVSRRFDAQGMQDTIEEELWTFLVAQEKESKKEPADKMLGGEFSWIQLGDDTEVIVKEVAEFLIDELAEEIVNLESF